MSWPIGLLINLRSENMKKNISQDESGYMNSMEEAFLNLALDYKRQYEECAWWRLSRRRELLRLWRSAANLMIRDGGLNKNK